MWARRCSVITMRRTFFATIAVLIFVPRSQTSPYPQVLKTLSLDDVIPLRPDFYPERLAAQWISETEYIYTDYGIGVQRHDAATGETVKIIDESDLHNLTKQAVTSFSSDGSFALLSKNRKKLYRSSFIAEYSVFDMVEKTHSQIGRKPLQVAMWGSDRSLAYVRDNNVYYIPDVTKKEERQLTKDGVPGEVFNGVTDWIYEGIRKNEGIFEEEVFSSPEALWFSADGTYLAVGSFNDTLVESASFPYYGDPSDINNQYPQLVTFKYPKAGRTNPAVELRVFNLHDADKEPWSIPAPVGIVGMDHILGRVNWASDNNLVVLWMNRRQNVTVLLNCNLKKDKCDIVQEHTEPNGWIDIYTPIFDRKGTMMFDVQPQYNGEQRYMHVSGLDLKSHKMSDLSPGNSTVSTVLGWNEDLETVYYVVSPSILPWQRQIWANSEGVSRCITCKEPSCHNTVANFAPTAMFAIISCSASGVVPKVFLYNAKKDSFKLLLDNSALQKKLSEYKLPTPLYSAMSIGHGNVAHVRLLTPPDMKPDEKYPMIVKVYSGPGTSRVRDNFEFEYNTYLSGNRSFIVCYVDVRGSGAMGVEAKHAVNNALGTFEIFDTLEAVRQLVKTHNFIDGTRVGVWGWSYGGFAAGMLLVHDTDKTFACGASIAPVTSWLYYDSIYTERFMDTPQANNVGYQRADLVVSAGRLRGRQYLLVHGAGDDNVHYQNSMLLSKRLQHLDIAFQQMSYPDENHSLTGVSRHLYHTLDHFWTTCFK